MSRQRGFKPKSAKNKRALEALDQKAVEALAAAFPGRPGQFPSGVTVGQPEAHWSPSVRMMCQMEWCDECQPLCDWGCCYCECECHDKE